MHALGKYPVIANLHYFLGGIILFGVNNFSLAEGNIKGPSVGTDRWCGVVRTDARAIRS